jgi:hypothetical protein
MEKFFNFIKSLFMVKADPQTPPSTPPSVPQAPTVVVSPKDDIVAVPHPTIAEWAAQVGHFEGSPDGNLKFTSLTQSWGASPGRPAGDGGFFCKWQNEAQGVQALCNFLTLAAANELIPYHNCRTIKLFTLEYTNYPKPEYDYSDNLIKALGVSADFNISNFIS